MNQRETRRINPVAHVATCAVAVLIALECLMIFGVLELEARTVARYAPWAYESFLKLVGEHPESMPRWVSIEEPEDKEAGESAVAEAAGIELSAIPLLIDTNEAAGVTNPAPDEALPTELVPATSPSTSPAAPREVEPTEIEPVG
jgi:hypothetical protein